jgi:hypothetical protein
MDTSTEGVRHIAVELAVWERSDSFLRKWDLYECPDLDRVRIV